eukprot:SAG11_NODE_1182_length_5595_cov_1.928311_1_plen_245_part_00
MRRQFPDVKEVFTCSNAKVPNPRSPRRELPKEAYTKMRMQCPKLTCAVLGSELSTTIFDHVRVNVLRALHAFHSSSLCPQVVEDQYNSPDRILDLSGPDYVKLTDTGLLELVKYCPQIMAVFVDNDGHVTESGLNALKKECSPHLQCAVLGREINLETFRDMQRLYARNRNVNVGDSLWSNLTVAGVAEIAAIFTDIDFVTTGVLDQLLDQLNIDFSISGPIFCLQFRILILLFVLKRSGHKDN